MSRESELARDIANEQAMRQIAGRPAPTAMVRVGLR